uniref:LamG-like jellyroll fold domain-containing protein n=1 Tax=unclassified Variovorax TaxID=663243 RepID=UPI000D368911
MIRGLNARHACAGMSLCAALLLAACGGGGGSGFVPLATTPPSAGAESPAPATNQGRSGPKALVVEIDGLTHAALRDALAQGKAPALQAFQVAPAWTGGANGTLSEQRTTDAPAWATLLTGTWAPRHGVRWDGADQRIDTALAPSMFAVAKQNTAAGYKTGAVTANPLYPALLANETGSIDTAVDCAKSDACVTERTAQLIDAGHDLVVAQYGAPADAAAGSGTGSDAYRRAVADSAAALGQLLQRIARRTANDAKEDWLVIVTTGHGLDAYGTTTGLQTLDGKTVFIASNKTLAGLPGAGTAAPADTDALLQLAAATDIAPTVLRHLGVVPPAQAYGWNGMALQAANGIRGFTAKTGAGKDSIELSWTLGGSANQPVQVLRDGKLLATLAAGSTTYADFIDAPSDGSYRYVYTLAAGDVAVSLSAQIAYLKPVPLAPTLVNGLMSYHPLDALPSIDARSGASTLAPWAADAQAGALVTDDGMGARYRAKALRVDSRIANAGGMSGYRLLPATDVTTDAGTTAFTIGFWVRTDATCSQGVGNGGTVIANKNYDTGNNEGIAIGLFGSCELRFNTGTGSGRGEIKGAHFLSAGQWAYVAMVIDKAGLAMNAYAIDPVRGVQTGRVALSSALVAKLGGLKNGIGLNEDGTGLYYQRQPSSPRGAMDFNDFAIWNRALTADEIASLYRSARPLSTLLAP